jgi:hypothetical protein
MRVVRTHRRCHGRRHHHRHRLHHSPALRRPASPTASRAQPTHAPRPPAITHALTDVGPLTFVASRDAVIEDPHGCAHVRGGGILVTLGPVDSGRAGRPRLGGERHHRPRTSRLTY